MEPILKIISNDQKQVVMQVREMTSEELAKNPEFTANMAYLTITRGQNHTLTILHHDRLSVSFSWGVRGTTLISDNMKKLRRYVENFLVENLVFIDLPHDGITHASTFYSKQLNFYQLNVYQGKDVQNIMFRNENERQDIMNALGLKFKYEEANPYVEAVQHYTI